MPSPDGTEIAFMSNRDGSLGLWRMSIEGGEARRIGNVKDFDWNPAWSHDGTRIALDSQPQDRGAERMDWRVWIVDAATGERQQVTESPSRAPCWSPNDKKLFFVGAGETETAGDLWEIDLETGREKRLTDFGQNHGRLGPFALETDGEYLYFLWETDIADLWLMDLELGP